MHERPPLDAEADLANPLDRLPVDREHLGAEIATLESWRSDLTVFLWRSIKDASVPQSEFEQAAAMVTRLLIRLKSA